MSCVVYVCVCVGGGGGGACGSVYVIHMQWRAPSLERGVSRVGNFFLGPHCIIMYEFCAHAHPPNIPSEITARAVG